MEIPNAGVRADLAAQQQLWSLVKARRQSQLERREGQAFVEERLGSLLLGQDLGPAEQAVYVRRLAATSERAREIGQAIEVPDFELARVPRDRLLCRMGAVSWRPFPIGRREVQVTPLQRRQQERLALALKTEMALSPLSQRRSVVALKFGVERAGVPLGDGDEDRVELSGYSLEALEIARKMHETPTLPAPRFLYATVAPGALDATASSSR